MSWIVTSAASKNMRWNSPSSVTAPPAMYWLCCDPLPHCHRPVTRQPSPSRTALPLGAYTPAATVFGSPKISRAQCGSWNRLIDDVVDPIMVHHPAAPSATATFSIAAANVTASASGPP